MVNGTSNPTPTSAVAESGGFLCDNERQRMTQKTTLLAIR